jgi:SNF2 family DNA or RNA helicase
MIKQLHKALKPYLLRRTKAEVCLDLPPKIEKIIYCPQTPLQKEIHRCILKKLEYEDEQQKQNKSKHSFLPRELSRYPSTAYDFSMEYQQEEYSFQNLVMQLRKICNHSYLFLEDMKSIPDDLYEKFLLESSGKLYVLNKLLDSLLQQKSKVSPTALFLCCHP